MTTPAPKTKANLSDHMQAFLNGVGIAATAVSTFILTSPAPQPFKDIFAAIGYSFAIVAFVVKELEG